MTRRTITIERFHCYGTPRHNLRATYRGQTLRHANHDAAGFYLGETWYTYCEDSPEGIAAIRTVARRLGFTHCRFVGDWARATKPKGGRL